MKIIPHYAVGGGEYDVRILAGKEYVVVGFSMSKGEAGAALISFDVRDESGNLSSILATDCALVDARPSSSWVIGSGNEGAFTCWPPKFHDPDWIERLYEYDEAALREFEELASRA